VFDGMCVFVLVNLCVCVRVRACESACVCVCAYVRACERACLRECVCMRASVCLCEGVRACIFRFAQRSDIK
jgi:hypothetical protein